MEYVKQNNSIEQRVEEAYYSSQAKAYIAKQAQTARWKKLYNAIVKKTNNGDSSCHHVFDTSKNKEVPLNNTTTYYVGMDIADETFTAAIFQTPDNPVRIKENIPNTQTGYQEFIKWLKTCHVATDNTILCMEATGVYGEDLAHYLIANDYTVAVEPPLKVKRAFYPVGHKNDRVDSQKIAEYAYRYHDQLRLYHPRPDIVEKLKHFLVLREQLIKQSTAIQNAVKAYQRHMIQEQMVIHIQQQHLSQIKEHIEQVDRQIKKLIKKDPDLWDMAQRLDTLCGVGILLASHLLVVTNMFRDISEPKRISAFVGICPYEHTSGKSVYRLSRCRPFGSMPIKKLLILAARSVATHNLNFRKYYLRKLDEGKPKKVVLNNIANKLVKIAAAMIRDKQPYIQNYKSVHPQLLAVC